MTKSKRGRYTLEFKQEAARLVESGQSQAAAARSLGVVEQTLGNWVREHRAGTLKGVSSKPQVTAEQMENSRLRAELARVTMERDILGKATAYFAAGCSCHPTGANHHLSPPVPLHPVWQTPVARLSGVNFPQAGFRVADHSP
jgi:transposase